MAEYNAPLKDIDDYKVDLATLKMPSRRIGVRYVREDIAASVCKISIVIFGFGFTKEITVELVDISSKGVLIATTSKLKLNRKITITLKFEDDRTFVIKAKIVRAAPCPAPFYQYGIKFDRLNNELGDYLLHTQRKLVFK